MFKYIFCITAVIMAYIPVKAISWEREYIKSMCGCYEVTFRFSETFTDKHDYVKKDDKIDYALELVVPITDNKDTISLQHLLIVGNGKVLKHWRQDWIYENTRLFKYSYNQNWYFIDLPRDEVEGEWSQLVYQVNDSPRYSGSSKWIKDGDIVYWESTADAPLPRRDATTRDDYNVLARRNRHQITEDGWLHEQDNLKIVRNENSADTLTAEKGLNSYRKIADEECAAAQKWWDENKEFWVRARAAWKNVLERYPAFHAEKYADGEKFTRAIEEMPQNSTVQEIEEKILKFVSGFNVAK